MNTADKLRLLLARALAVRMALSDSMQTRIDASVVRPLSSLLDPSPEPIATSQGAGVDNSTDTWSDPVFELAEEATSLYATTGSVGLFEAAAALQDLACEAAESETAALERRQRLRMVNGDGRATIQLSPNGPLLVKNVANLIKGRKATTEF